MFYYHYYYFLKFHRSLCGSLGFLFFSFFIQLQEVLRERICHQQLPVRPEGVEAQHKWDIIIFITIFITIFSVKRLKG